MAIEMKTLGTVEGVTFTLAESTLAGRFTQEELAEAFNLVTAGMEDWKARISTTVPASLRDVVAAAIEHFTGSEATFQPEGQSGAYLRVRARGYYGAGA
jgi:hypothetical protein